MTTFVLVPGFWLGAWAWRPVTTRLRELGHDVYPLSLTGLAERAHLARPDTDLDVHITDVVNLLTYEDLHDVVLVGHSYGGMVVTGAAERMPERVARLGYVDGGPVPDGFAQIDMSSPEERAATEDLVRTRGDGWLLPPPPWADLAAGVEGVDPVAIAERSTPQPWASVTSPLRTTGAWEKLPHFAILSSFTAEQMAAVAATVPAFRLMSGAGWQFDELPTWHWPMFSRPAELADALDQAGHAGSAGQAGSA